MPPGVRRRLKEAVECEAEALARLRAQQASLDPFEPNRRIEDKLGAIYELARPRLSPSWDLLPSQSLTR